MKEKDQALAVASMLSTIEGRIDIIDKFLPEKNGMNIPTLADYISDERNMNLLSVQFKNLRSDVDSILESLTILSTLKESDKKK